LTDMNQNKIFPATSSVDAPVPVSLRFISYEDETCRWT